MIGVKVDGERLDTYQDTKVSLELVSPIFSEDALSPGSISYPFDIPAGDESPKNNDLLGVPDVIENAGGSRKVDAVLEVDEVPYKQGKLVIRGYDRNRASANLNFGVRARLGEDFKNKKLGDVLDEAIQIWSPFSHSPAWYKEIYLKPGAAAPSPLKLTVNGREYTNATLSGLATDISSDTTEPRATATYVAAGTTHQGMTGPYIVIKPYTGDQSPLTPLSVNFEGNGVDTASFRWLVHGYDPTEYNAVYQDFFTDNFDDTRFGFPYVKNDNPYGEPISSIYFTEYYEGFGSFAGGTKITNDMNRANAGVLIMNDPNWGYNNNRNFVVKNTNSLQPFIRVRHVLNKIKTHFGFEYEGDFVSKPELDEAFFWNTAPLDVAMDYIGSKKFVFYRSGFNLKELVPETMTVRDFFQALKSRYNLMLEMNEANGNLVIKMLEPIARNIFNEDITQYCGAIAKQEDLRVTGFRMVCEKQPNNDLAILNQLEVDTPEKEVKILLKAFTEPIRASQKSGSKFDLQIFYMRTPSNGGTGSGSANPLTGAWIETLAGEDGIYETFWKYWLYFEGRRRSVTLPVAWPFRKIQNFDFSLKVRLDRNNYMVKKINVEIGGGQDVSVSSVELYTMV